MVASSNREGHSRERGERSTHRGERSTERGGRTVGREARRKEKTARGEEDEAHDLPPRMIAAGEDPLGERVNAYHNLKTLSAIIEALEPSEIEMIRKSPLGKLLELPSQTGWSGAFGLFLLSRQVVVAKKHEIWIIFGGSPVRFSLKEFKIVTGLACGQYLAIRKKKRKGIAGKATSFYLTLFGLELGVSVERVIQILQRKKVTDVGLRLRNACLALVDGYLLPTNHYPKVDVDHAEMVADLDTFLPYPWGRVSFEMIMTSVKERDVVQLATSSISVQGFLYALQLVVLKAVPAIQEGLAVPPAASAATTELPVSESDEEADSEDSRRPSEPQVEPLKLAHTRALDKECNVSVEPIICSEIEFCGEDLSWKNDGEDVKVDRMVKLVKEGFSFSNEMFKGGSTVEELKRLRKQSKERKVKPPSGRGGPQHVRCAASLRRPRLSPVDLDEEPLQSLYGEEFSRMLDEKLDGVVVRVIEDVTDWFARHVVVGDKLGGSEDNSADDTTIDANRTDVVNGGDHFDSPAGGVGGSPAGGVGGSLAGDGISRNPIVGDFVSSVEEVAAFYNQENSESPEASMNRASSPPLAAPESTVQQTSEPPEVYTNRGSPSQVVDSNVVATMLPLSEDSRVDSPKGNELTPPPLVDNMEITRGQVSEQAPDPNIPGIHSSDVNEEHHAESQIPEGEKVGVVDARKSKRMRTLSSRLDGRFKCDKRTKLLLGHPSPTIDQEKAREERFISSMEKLKKTRAAMFGGGVTISEKNVHDLIEMKKSVPSKVINALIKFSSHLLRSDDIDGRKLRVEVFDSKFVSQLTRLYGKFKQHENVCDFKFLESIVRTVEGGGDSDRLALFADAEFVYMPFNFDKKTLGGPVPRPYGSQVDCP